jgi:hypothetical protein
VFIALFLSPGGGAAEFITERNLIHCTNGQLEKTLAVLFELPAL